MASTGAVPLPQRDVSATRPLTVTMNDVTNLLKNLDLDAEFEPLEHRKGRVKLAAALIKYYQAKYQKPDDLIVIPAFNS